MFDLNKALKDKILSMSTEDLQAIVDKVEGMDISGPTVQEYFYSLQQSLQITSFQYHERVEDVEYCKFEFSEIERHQSAICSFQKTKKESVFCSKENDIFSGGSFPKAA